MSAAQIPEFAVLAAAHELAAHLTDPGDVDTVKVAEAMLRVALPLVASKRLRLEIKAALLENFVEAVREVPGIGPVQLAEEAFDAVVPYLRGAPPATVHEVHWRSGHTEFVPAHYVAYEEDTVRLSQETEEAGYVVLLAAAREDIRTIRRVPSGGEPVPAMPDDEGNTGEVTA